MDIDLMFINCGIVYFYPHEFLYVCCETPSYSNEKHMLNIVVTRHRSAHKRIPKEIRSFAFRCLLNTKMKTCFPLVF